MSADSLDNVIGIVAELVLVADDVGTVVELSKELVAVTGCSAVDVDAFHDKRAGGLTGGNIVVGSVDRGDYVVASLSFCGVGLFYNSSLAPYACVVVVMIIGLNLCRTVIDVAVNNKVLHTLAVLIIRNDGGLSYAGSKCGLGRRRNSQAVLGALNSFCGRGDREDRHDHQKRQHDSNDT